MTEVILVTYAEAARRLGFRSDRSVRRLVEKGLLPAVYPLQRSPRIRLADLEAYIVSDRKPVGRAQDVPDGIPSDYRVGTSERGFRSDTIARPI